jgi:hypothetical protein
MDQPSNDRPAVKPDHYAILHTKLAAIEAAEDVVRRQGQPPTPCCGPEAGPPCLSCSTDEPPSEPDLIDVVAFVARERAEEEIGAYLADREPVADYDDDMPTEAEVSAYYAWRAEADARAVVEHPDFRTTLARAAELFEGSENPHLNWLGGMIGELYDLALHLEATSGEQFRDRLDCMRDAARCR